MENLLSALAFAGLIAAQFLSVVLVNTQRCEDPSPGTRNRIARAPRAWLLPHSDRKAFSWALGCLCDYWMECSEIDIARSARARRTRPSLSEIGRDRCGLGRGIANPARRRQAKFCLYPPQNVGHLDA